MTLTWWRVRAAQQSGNPRGRRRPAGPARRAGFKPRVEALEDRCVPAVDVILEWNAVMLQANAVDHSTGAPEEGGPTLTARAFAIVSAAMYDAYNSIHPIGDPYLTVAPNADHASSEAAVAQAGRDTLVALYPSQRVAFNAALTQTLARVPDGPFEDRGRAVGRFVAERILQARANDNADSIQVPPYVPNGLKGFHNVDPTNPGQGFYAPDYGSVTPFALRSAEQFGPPALDDGTPAGRAAFLRSQAYTLAYDEVRALGGDGVTTPTVRTPEQTTIGIFWGYDGRPGLGTPNRLYDQIVRTVAIQEHNTEAQNARLFALVNIAMADGGLTCWDRKYDDAFWRPILGIRGGNSDGNPLTEGDPHWTPLGAQASNPRPGEKNFTPNFPSYTSGHATFGAATFQTLARFYGRDDITFTVISDEFNGITRGADGAVRPIVARTFHSFSQAAEENGQSRIYLGIHWAFDKTAGIRSGNQVANFVFNNFLRPLGAVAASPALAADTPATAADALAGPAAGGPSSTDAAPPLADPFRLAAAAPADLAGPPAAVQATAALPAPGTGGPFSVTVYQPPSAAAAADAAPQLASPGQTAAGAADPLRSGWADDALKSSPFSWGPA
jgi:hypothetical protein